MAAEGQRSPKLTTIIDAAVKYFRYCLSLFILFHSQCALSKKAVFVFRVTEDCFVCKVVLQKIIVHD